MHGWLWLALAIGSEVVATSSLKASEGFTRLVPSAVVIIGYALSFWALSISLKTIPLGICYAIWSAIGTAAILLIGRFVFHQPMTALQYVGVATIIVGVMLMNLSRVPE